MHYVPTDWHHCAQKGQGLVATYIGIAWLMGSLTVTLLPISEFSMYTEMPPMQVLHTEALGGAGLHNIQIQYKPVRSVGYKCG